MTLCRATVLLDFPLRSLYSVAPLSNGYQCQRARLPAMVWWRCRCMTGLPTTMP